MKISSVNYQQADNLNYSDKVDQKIKVKTDTGFSMSIILDNDRFYILASDPSMVSVIKGKSE